MKPLIAGLMALLASLWAWALLDATTPPEAHPAWYWRQEGLNLSGLMAIMLMSLSMYLATRPRWLEGLLGGMDRVYRTHKWAGLLSGGWALTHWLIEMSDDVLKAWIGREGRLPREHLGGVLDALRDLGKDLGEWAIYALLAMLLITLWRRVPYRYWRSVHRGMPLIYLMLAAHAALLAPTAYWTQPVGALMAGMLLAGTYGSVVALFGRIGSPQAHAGQVIAVVPRGQGVMQVRCQMQADWPGHQPGQFAWVRFAEAEGAHPFTLAAADRGDGSLTFEIKALGEYTAALSQRLKPGLPVRIEGPYGRFVLRRVNPDRAQCWVAGGIGITPFLAWLEALPNSGLRMPAVVLHYAIRSRASDPLLSRVQALCAALPNVDLQVHAGDDPGASAWLSRLGEQDDGRKREVWFCGPQGLADRLHAALAAAGKTPAAFHQEAFMLR